MAKKWIANAVKHKGRLHAHLGVPEGEKIPAEKLESARHSNNPTIRREAALAHTLGGFHHEKKIRACPAGISSQNYTIVRGEKWLNS